MQNVVVVVPVYNEEANIGSLLAGLDAVCQRGWPLLAVVVNDGSTDQTAQIARSFSGSMPVKVVDHPCNLGVGQGFRSGFRAAFTLAPDDNDLIVTIEGDNTSDLGILEQMLLLARQEYDLVLASVYAPGGGVEGTNPIRVLLSAGANLLVRWLLGIKGVCTYSSFYRVHRAGLLRAAESAYDGCLIEEKGFVCMVEMLDKLYHMGARIAEVPMILRGSKRRGPSKMRVLHTVGEYLGYLGRSLRVPSR